MEFNGGPESPSTRDHVAPGDALRETESDTESAASSYSNSDCSDDLEPEWLDDVQKNGELFYLELSEGEEEAALVHSSVTQGLSTNHVRFSDKEAEIITDGSKNKERYKREPRLKKLVKILRKKRPSQHRVDAPQILRPASILKNQAGQRAGLVVQQQQLKEVFVYLNPKRLGGCSPSPERGGLLQALLGVVHRPSWGRGEAQGRREERLTVHGLLPNSPAIRGGQVLIGDVLVAIDDVDVTSENIERVLSCIPGPTQVKLTLETASPGEGLEPAPPSGRPSPPVSQLVKLLWGEDLVELQMSISHIPHIVMYLSLKLDSESAKDEQEILYQFPTTEASTQLKGVRGVFLTLCDMLGSVTGGRIVSSSMLLSQHLVHVGYWKEGERLLVVGLPADRVPLLHLKTVMANLVRTLRVMYGSLDRAFSEEEHCSRLDCFFSLFFQRLIDNPGAPTLDAGGVLFLDGLPAVRWLTLPPEVKVDIDTILSDFESSDFGEMAEDYFGLRRLYVILGSCLFYKGYLTASHLPKEDLLDVALYCQHFGLLPLASEQRIGQLVIWREVFPHRLNQSAASGVGQGYGKPQGRRFLLIVGVRHFMQCVLLEAGGCAAPALGSPGPDCVYVDQVKATLLQLEGLQAALEERLAAPPAPCLSCADWFLPAGRERQDGPAGSPVFGKLVGSIKASSPAGRRGLFGDSAPLLRTRRPSPQRSLSDSGSDGPPDGAPFSGLSPHSTPDSTRKLTGRRDSLGSGGSDGSSGSGGLFKTPKKKHPNPFYLGTLKRSLSERDAEAAYSTMKLSSGAENTLFHYVCMETVQGIFIAPTHREVAQLSGSIHPQLIRNFHRCCLSIRAAFQQSLASWERQGADGHQGPRGLGPVKEHGVLFQCKPENWNEQKKPAPTMTYWVIGRMHLEPVPQEFYVCFHDSVTELPVEMAFRLSFGLAS
ncbi:protein inturned isoform X1 [Brienomyrus brachyistius]|uniref:protein inturned isoform X1 n=1 Tax=Brienomyrus brachyistius TaxID=42636 RepID=UPI0020B257DA|nr:protein inturned isoform X1 [Brienomyrus brachyistius]